MTGSQASETIRSFSDFMEAEKPGNQAGHALAIHMRKQKDSEQRQKEAKKVWEKKKRQDEKEWQKWWETGYSEPSRDADNKLLEQTEEVTDVWKQFRSTFKDSKLPQVNGTTPPTIDLLKSTVINAGKEWDDKKSSHSGKAKAYMFSVVEKIDGHKTLFSLFPSETIYTSVLCGVVSTFVTACVNYEKVAEGFSNALKDISEEMSYTTDCNKELAIPSIKGAIARTYVEVFEFLCTAMQWFSSKKKRLLEIFNSRFFEQHIAKHVNEVKKMAEVIGRELNKQTSIVVMQIQSSITDVQKQNADQSRRETGIESAAIKFRVTAEKLERVGEQAVALVNSVKEQVEYKERLRQTQTQSVSDTNLEGCTDVNNDEDEEEELEQAVSIRSNSTCEESKHYYARAEIEQYSSRLEPYAQARRIDVSVTSRVGIHIPRVPLTKVQQWLTLSTSALIWIEGPPSPADLSSVALRISTITAAAGIPCIFFSQKQRFAFASESESGSELESGSESETEAGSGSGSTNSSVQERGLISLLYTFIVQLMNLLPPSFETEQSFEEDQFKKLDGTMKTASNALRIIQSLLEHAPSYMVCVVDGLQLLEDEDTVEALEQLLEILRDRASKSIVKVLFTTDGMSRILRMETELDERAYIPTLGTRIARKRGRPTRAKTSLSELTIRSRRENEEEFSSSSEEEEEKEY